ncbi:MAG TPA: TlpA disulfide reductase family protein [Gammaproteobacteria bacterium]
MPTRTRTDPPPRWLALLPLLWLLAGCGGEAQAPGPRVGEPFPALDIPGLDRDPLRLGELRDRLVVLNLWATWCAPCREEMPALQRLSRRHPDGRLTVIGLSVDEDLNLVREFLLKYAIDFPVAIDPGGALADGVLGVRAYPDTFIIAPGGKLVERIGGSRAWDGEEMVSLLEKWLPGR